MECTARTNEALLLTELREARFVDAAETDQDPFYAIVELAGPNGATYVLDTGTSTLLNYERLKEVVARSAGHLFWIEAVENRSKLWTQVVQQAMFPSEKPTAVGHVPPSPRGLL